MQRVNKAAWAQGYDAGWRGEVRNCPFLVDGVLALSWQIGYVEGRQCRSWRRHRDQVPGVWGR
jgi:hypothetical protein